MISKIGLDDFKDWIELMISKIGLNNFKDWIE